MRAILSLIGFMIGCTYVSAQVQNISAWTLQTSDSADVTVGGITYLNNYATPLTITTAVGTYDAGTAGAGADSVFIRRNTATPTSTTNVAGQDISSLSASSGSTTVYGTYSPTIQDLLLGGNILNSTWDTFANTSSGAGGIGNNIERIDFVWSQGYTVVGDEVLIVFNFDPAGAQDDFRVAVFTGIDNSVNKLPTAYSSAGVLVSGTNYPDKLPLPLSGSPTISTSTGFRTTATDNLSGTALNIGDSQTVGIGGVAISLATLGISAGQTIYGYSLLSGDVNAASATNLIDFTNSSIYPTSTPNADASGTPDFSTFGGKIATSTVSVGSAAFEWDNGAGTSKWGSTVGGESNNNWYSPVSAENNRTPFRDGDVLFGNRVSTNQIVDLDNNVEVRTMTFDSAKNYTIGVSGDTPTITFGDPNIAGLPSIEATAVNGNYRDYTINANINLVENFSVNNNSQSAICINGTIATNSALAPDGNTITATGTGTVNFNGAISGSGDLVVNTSALASINANNSTSAWIGNVDVQDGQLLITTDGALGGSVNRTNDLTRSSGNTTLQVLNANATDLKVGQLVSGTNIPAGTYITAISVGGSETTITLSNAFTGSVSNSASITFAGATTVENGASLTLRPDRFGTALNYTTAETITLNGTGVWNGTTKAGAIFNDGGDNTLGSAVSIRLGSDSGIGSRDGNLTINGVISGAYSLTKLGEGVVTLANSANSYSGGTIISNGALRITAETALPGGFATGAPSGGNLTLAGGVLEIGTNVTFTRRLGTSADQVQFTGDGGFSAYGSARTVTLTNSTGTAGGALTWGAGSFVPTGNALLLSSNFSDNTVTFTNAIALGSVQREIRVANGSAAIDAVLSGVLSGTGGISKTGDGTLDVGTGNTYTGATEIKAGSVRGTVSTSNLQLNGGVRDVSGNTSITLGTAAGNVQWTGDGGFAAVGGAYTLNLSSGAALTWGTTGSFIGAANTLKFGSVGADNTLTLTNNLSLGTTGTRTIQTIAGTASLATVATGGISGVVSGAANLAVTGNGRLDLTAANTNSGTVTITGSEMRLTGTNGAMASATGFTIQQGGALTLDNAASVNTSRVGNSATVALKGGTLAYYGQTANSNTAETIGVLSLTGGANTVDVVNNRSGKNTTLTVASLSRSAGATVDFTNSTSTNGTYGTGNTPRLTFGTTSPTLDDGILAYATVNGADFATISSSSIVAQTTYDTGAQTGWTATTDNAAPTVDATLTAARTINSLKLGSGIDVAQAGFTLTVQSGGILTTGSTAATISGGSLTTGNSNELIVHAYNTGGTTISSTLTGSGGLTKTGTGTLTLSGTTANTLTGTTYVNDGTLTLAKSAGVTAIAGNITVGDGSGTDTLRIAASEQIADTAAVTLRGNSTGGTGESILSFGATDALTSGAAGITETFASLTIEGTAIIDFAGGTLCDPNYLFLSALNIPTDGKLLIRNWNEFTDFLMVDSSFNVDSVLSRIEFEGYADKTFSTTYGTGWNQIRPVPEPSTYGFMMLGGGIAFYGFRRWRQSKSAVQNKA